MKGKVIIVFAILLMVSFILVLDAVFRQPKSEATLTQTQETESAIPVPMAEEEVFNLSEMALQLKQLEEVRSTKTLDDYYANRAYDGAPPIIPHRLISESGIGGKTCLQCHGKGGYVAEFEAFAPITPHPDFLNCKQCHVPVKTAGNFVSSRFERPQPKGKSIGVLDGSPPAIPHDFQVRGSCLSCHGGPSAPQEIRVTHPERVNCLQCHAPTANRSITWTRKSEVEEEGGGQ